METRSGWEEGLLPARGLCPQGGRQEMGERRRVDGRTSSVSVLPGCVSEEAEEETSRPSSFASALQPVRPGHVACTLHLPYPEAVCRGPWAIRGQKDELGLLSLPWVASFCPGLPLGPGEPSRSLEALLSSWWPSN